MKRAKRTGLLAMIYLAITLALLVCAIVAVHRGLDLGAVVSLIGMVAMAVITDKVNDRCRDMTEYYTRAGELR